MVHHETPSVIMDLSVVIVNWNTRDLVLKCLRSLDAATENLSAEVFVVDNGSTDGSVAAIRQVFPEVVVVPNRRNLGFARANNKALRRARGKYILLLNSDVILRGDTVAALMQFMEETPLAGMAGAQLLNSDGSKQNSFDNFPTLLSEGFNKSLLRILLPRRFPSKRVTTSSPLEVESVIGACVLVRREAIEAVGLLDEGYFFFMEETDWCYRMMENGWRVYIVPRAEAVHVQGATVQTVKGRAKVEYYRSRYLFFRKHRSRLQTGVLVGVLFFKLGVSLVLHGFMCLLTLFQDTKARQKLAVTWTLLSWHILFCPESRGLEDLRE
jgi:hypothetical protein